MPQTISEALQRNLLGNAPGWYKLTILGFLLANPLLLASFGPFVTGWILIAEFIFTLAMALKCYPLPAGGLLAIEAVFIGLTHPETVYHEALNNFEVILLLIFMVAGIYFMKDLLQFAFTKILTKIKSKIAISLLFCFAGAFLSAFLDALTVTAVIIAVAYGFYAVYHKHTSGGSNLTNEDAVKELAKEDLKQFRAYLRNLMMHGAVGTALGGVCTLVGEPQNLLIGSKMGWHFPEFFIKVAPISIPVLISGLLTCVLVEKFHLFGYGYQIPGNVRSVLTEESAKKDATMGATGKARLLIQACVAVWLIVALAFHLAAVGLVGLSVIILLTALCGITGEHQIGKAFEEALPFTALLVVFFSIVAVIHDQHLFKGIIEYVLGLDGRHQLVAYYGANGILSMISDNVFVATVYINETKAHFVAWLGALPGVSELMWEGAKLNGTRLMGILTDPHVNHSAEVLALLPEATRNTIMAGMEQFSALAVAINTGTNIPSVATPASCIPLLINQRTSGYPPVVWPYGGACPALYHCTITGLIATWYMQNWLLSIFGMAPM